VNIDLSAIKLEIPTVEEFREIALFSFENYFQETVHSIGESISDLRDKLGGPPTDPSSNDIWYGIKYGDKRIGFIWVELRPETESAFGYDINIDPEYRLQGIGRLAMNQCGIELKKRGLQFIEICVYEHNEIAKGLYKSLGFVVSKYDEVFKQYYLKYEIK
jgi:ribosomal protein S18 acetylase RimI-like enzyme